MLTALYVATAPTSYSNAVVLSKGGQNVMIKDLGKSFVISANQPAIVFVFDDRGRPCVQLMDVTKGVKIEDNQAKFELIKDMCRDYCDIATKESVTFSDGGFSDSLVFSPCEVERASGGRVDWYGKQIHSSLVGCDVVGVRKNVSGAGAGAGAGSSDESFSLIVGNVDMSKFEPDRVDRPDAIMGKPRAARNASSRSKNPATKSSSGVRIEKTFAGFNVGITFTGNLEDELEQLEGIDFEALDFAAAQARVIDAEFDVCKKVRVYKRSYIPSTISTKDKVFVILLVTWLLQTRKDSGAKSGAASSTVPGKAGKNTSAIHLKDIPKKYQRHLIGICKGVSAQ
jgi:hypothetical protein